MPKHWLAGWGTPGGWGGRALPVHEWSRALVGMDREGRMRIASRDGIFPSNSIVAFRRRRAAVPLLPRGDLLLPLCREPRDWPAMRG